MHYEGIVMTLACMTAPGNGSLIFIDVIHDGSSKE